MSFRSRYQALLIATPIALFTGVMALVSLGWALWGIAPLFLIGVVVLLAPRCPDCRRPVFLSNPSVMHWRAPKTCECGHDYEAVSSATSKSPPRRD